MQSIAGLGLGAVNSWARARAQSIAGLGLGHSQ